MPATLTPVSLRLTPEEYFDWENAQEEKHEYIHGEVFPMSGATREHVDIAGNVYVALRLAFRGTECAAFTSDMRVQVEPDGRYTYPDVSAVCGGATFLDAKKRTLTNPTLIVEVLSDSTETYDKGGKLDAYRSVPSIREVVFIRQDRRAAEVYRRGDDGRWTIEDVGGAGTLALASVGVDVPMDDVYEGTDVGGA